MFCTNCGKELEEGDRFCPYCGSPVESSKITMLSEKPNKQDQEEQELYGPPEETKPKGTIIRIAALAALIFFLFLPQVSCVGTGTGLSGIDLLKIAGQTDNMMGMAGQTSSSAGPWGLITFLSIVIIAVCVIALAFPRAFLGLIGLGAELIMFIYAKSSDIGPAIKIDVGGILTAISLLVMSFGAKIEEMFLKSKQS